jgi:Zn-dependent peptidase ImmA (M78 family)
MTLAPVKPVLLRWARERLGRSVEDFGSRFRRLAEWERGESLPTLKQLEAFAKATRVPLGYFFLPEPPELALPIPDLRTIRRDETRQPSPDLLDTIHAMQRRQAWLREELIECEAEPLYFVGSAGMADDAEAVGREMRRTVGLDDGWAATVRTWQAAVGELRRAIEQLGVIAVINGVVGNNTHRKLDVEEFRGFALSDNYAPLVFVNGSDAKAAQSFTLVHELAHIWLGNSALTDVGPSTLSSHDMESWCDRAAAEFLVPAGELKAFWKEIRHDDAPFEAVARRFKVSPIVAGRRAMDLHLVDRETFFTFYREYTTRDRRQPASTGGGDFYNNQNSRVGERFATQVIRAAKGGRLSFKEAYNLTDLRGDAFREYANRMRVMSDEC